MMPSILKMSLVLFIVSCLNVGCSTPTTKKSSKPDSPEVQKALALKRERLEKKRRFWDELLRKKGIRQVKVELIYSNRISFLKEHNMPNLANFGAAYIPQIISALKNMGLWTKSPEGMQLTIRYEFVPGFNIVSCMGDECVGGYSATTQEGSWGFTHPYPTLILADVQEGVWNYDPGNNLRTGPLREVFLKLDREASDIGMALSKAQPVYSGPEHPRAVSFTSPPYPERESTVVKFKREPQKGKKAKKPKKKRKPEEDEQK